MSSTARRLAGAYSVDQAKVVPKEFLGNGYIKHTPALASTWRQIVEELPLPLHKHLIDICFVLLKPDALASNKGLAMWQKLIDHGLQPLLAWPCLDSGLRHFEELYKFNLTLNNNQCMLSSWWLHNQPYEMGPVIALLVRIPPEVRGDAAACDYFAHIKGPSNPFQAKPGQLRFDLVPTNMALNLLHSSDDPISCFREVRIFAPKSVVREGLLRAEQIESTAKDMVQVIGKAFEEFNIALRTVGYAEHDLDLVSTLVRLKLRLRLASRTEVGDLSSLMPRYLHLMQSRGKAEQRWHEFRLLCSEERRNSSSSSEHFMVQKLAQPALYSSQLADELAGAMTALRLPYARWEKIVIETSFFFHHHLPSE